MSATASRMRGVNAIRFDSKTDEVTSWIYAGDLTAHLGAHATCIVGQHIQRLSSGDDEEAISRWIAIFNKVSALLHAADQPVH